MPHGNLPLCEGDAHYCAGAAEMIPHLLGVVAAAALQAASPTVETAPTIPTTVDALYACVTQNVPRVDMDAVAASLANDSGEPPASVDWPALVARLGSRCSNGTQSGNEAVRLTFFRQATVAARPFVLTNIGVSEEQRAAFEAALGPYADAVRPSLLPTSVVPTVSTQTLVRAHFALENAGFTQTISDRLLTGYLESLASDRLLRPRIVALLALAR
jgi:hypothetical protein